MSGRVLVTGASGFVGRHVVWALLERGFEVHGVTRSGEVHSEGGVVWHTGDLLQPGTAEDLIDRVDPSHMVHAAWFTEPGRYPDSMVNLEWAEASVRLLRSFHRVEGRRSVSLGSCFEYEWSSAVLPESKARVPSTVYGSSKAAVGDLVCDLARLGLLDAAWARLFYLFGPYEHPRRLASSIALSVLRGQEAPMSHGNQLRDYMYVGDVGDAVAAVLSSPVTGAVNVGTGSGIRLSDLALAVARCAGREDLVKVGALPSRPGEPVELVADPTRLLEEVGWRTRFGFEEGIERTVAFWRSEVGQE